MQQLIHIMVFLIISISAQAKWANHEDAPTKSSSYTKINVDSNGKIKVIQELTIEILKEPGRTLAANYTIVYNGYSEKIKILAAKTIYRGKEHKLNQNLIEDKPLASSPGGFDQMRQILLAFPKAEIGAKIYLKYEVAVIKIPIEKFYARLFSFGENAFEEASRIKLHSQIPLHILINDPEKILSITKDKDDNFHNLEIVLTRPIYKKVINEPITNVVNNKHLTWISVSSLNQWEDLASRFGQFYTKVFTQPLSQNFLQIANAAAIKKDELEQINTITSSLNDKIQYSGDWRTIRGQIVPRDLDKISATQLGDCKDFSAVTAAILTKLGYKVQMVATRRGIGDFYPNTLPDLAAFNHAIVKVTTKQGGIYWIDPTNFQSMAGSIFPDIANKMALILDQKQPGYEKISNIQPGHAQVLHQRQIEITHDNKITVNGRVTLKNEEACPITGIALRISEASLKDMILDYLSDTKLDGKKSLQLPDLKSRIVKDITYTYSFEQNNGTLKTNLGRALKLTYEPLLAFLNVSQDMVTDIVLNLPYTATKQTIIKNIDIQNVTSLNQEIKSPWLSVSRKCSLNNNHDLQIDDVIVVHNNVIPNEDLKKPEFIALKDSLEKNFKDIVVVFNLR